jgi:hypothetical protein
VAAAGMWVRTIAPWRALEDLGTADDAVERAVCRCCVVSPPLLQAEGSAVAGWTLAFGTPAFLLPEPECRTSPGLRLFVSPIVSFQVHQLWPVDSGPGRCSAWSDALVQSCPGTLVCAPSRVVEAERRVEYMKIASAAVAAVAAVVVAGPETIPPPLV